MLPFLIITGAVVLAVVVLAWRMDRKRKVSIDRADPALERERDQALLQAQVHRTGETNQGFL